jgi:hypothetical protein
MLAGQRLRERCWSMVDLNGRRLIDVRAVAIDGAVRAFWI